MEKLKSTFTNMALALTLVAVFAGGLLAWVNNMTQGPIKAQEEKTLTDAIGLVMADGSLKVSSTDTVRINHDGFQPISFTTQPIAKERRWDVP